jgi:hypothetical protein
MHSAIIRATKPADATTVLEMIGTTGDACAPGGDCCTPGGGCC